ncbi:hypothetical protein A2165_01975 [Candidatus Curtissbacteria bacterium RBG_13_40_7]|uniref:Uncharacterized protein n=1 Tax=Candidatus Curtissbacteria bacterium RBG_13_40_7 TaxID=1797706 RepID=A0A1F5FU33_9BACT|nr:MAG: hypothetical protein A2165_01975 [Candidatus Curtissbacteria bacterium RBG_13_40_7]
MQSLVNLSLLLFFLCHLIPLLSFFQKDKPNSVFLFGIFLFPLVVWIQLAKPVRILLLIKILN